MKRKVLVFVVVQLALFCVFYLTLTSYYNSNFFNQNLNGSARDVKIEIVKGFPVGKDSLELNPLDSIGRAVAWGGKNITWVIREGSNVKSFRISKKGIFSRNVFKWFRGPRSLFYDTSGTGLIDNYKDSVEYEYWIHWTVEKKMDGKIVIEKHHFDPKIAVKPGGQKELLEDLIKILYALLVIIVSFMTFFRKAF